MKLIFQIANDKLYVSDADSFMELKLYFKPLPQDRFSLHEENRRDFFHLEKSGWYKIEYKCAAETGFRNEVLFHLTTRDYSTTFQELTGYCDKNPNQSFPTPQYFKCPQPHSDFIATNLILSNEFCKSYKLTRRFIRELNCTIFSEYNDISIYFSGYAWCGSKLYYGQKDIDSNSIPPLLGKTGNFTCVELGIKCLKIFTDIFSFQKIFVYQRKNKYIISNRYHLLILALNDAGVELSIKNEKIRALFASNVTLFRQIWTTELLVDDTYIVECGKYINLTESGLTFVRHEEYCYFDSTQAFDDDIYKNLLSKAALEIKDNIKSAINHEQFDRIVCDLSGGRDSRVNYAAITSLGKFDKSKVRIRTTLSEPEDLETAIIINNIYNYPYFDDFEHLYHGNLEKNTLVKRSYFMGYHFLWFIPTTIVGEKNKLRISGESFEALSVRYYSNQIDNPLEKDDSDDNVIAKYVEKLKNQALIISPDITQKIYNDLVESIGALPGSTPSERFDNFFLAFRGATHAGNYDRIYFEGHCILPLQSVSFIQLKHIWINAFAKNKIIYDITHELNPILSVLPYNQPKTNDDMLSAKANLLLNESFVSDARLDIVYNPSNWNAAYKKYWSGVSLVGVQPNRDEISLFVNDSYFSLVAEIFQNHVFSNFPKELIVMLYYYYKNFAVDDDDRRIIFNKLCTVHDIIRAGNVAIS